ncbi:MAG: tRNA (adenosine(37)-N6)-threonylcarbamoyltransferase complex ATPase subunit type 1 TsaE [Paracoccus sp. (in: a-proteobacteria)]|nr:tRNA (adenosine(37)-N6)-threonylcarbamoyltransferase complex ATPase subunit type 1 TsaE [Paracoccus sp. (in: a-proteobacteria)]
MRARIDHADETLTAAVARSLAATARAGDVLLLDGPVGAGKTHFARAFIKARQGDSPEDVPSPTFTIVQTYEARGEVWHADLYRLSHPDELIELGLDEALDHAICLIEWPDRMQAPRGLRLRLSAPDPDHRDLEFSGEGWPDLTRALARARFLYRSGWGEAWLEPLAGDASARRYFRLHGARTAVLMEDAAAPDAYLAMTGWLRERGFHAPEVLAQQREEGLLLLEDLGDDLVARVLEARPELTGAAYAKMTDLLVELHRHTPPAFVLRLDGAELARQVGLFAEYADAVGAQADLAPVIEALHADLCADVPPVCGLRDFHAENLIWQGETLGILDFQDAVSVHPAYDLVSGLQDVRREVPQAVEEAELSRYIAATGRDEARFRAAYALLGAQRNLRIMGIFTRLCARDGKPRYLDFMPRCWALIGRNLAHPALAPLAAALRDVPAPTPEIIEKIRRSCPI